MGIEKESVPQNVKLQHYNLGQTTDHGKNPDQDIFKKWKKRK